jgi:hypothetical protein
VSAVSFYRLSSAPPPLREVVHVDDDGRWRAWRSISRAVGRFAGHDDGGRRVLDAARAAVAAPLPASGGGGVLDEATDEIVVGGTSLEVPHGDVPPGPWGVALEACRDLVAQATDHPVAAIVLGVSEPGLLRLEHRGTERLEAELGSARFDAMAFDAAGMPIASTFGPVDIGPVDAGPGWATEVRVEPLVPPPGGRLEVELAFVVVDDGVYIPVSVVGEWKTPAQTGDDQIATRS